MEGRDRIATEAPLKEGFIFGTASSASTATTLETGAMTGAGTFYCVECGCQMSMRESDRLPECPRCGTTEFRRDSMFEPMQEHDTTAEFPVPTELRSPDWLHEARESLPGSGRYLVCRGDCMSDEGGGISIFEIKEGWTRIGRSVAADIRLDDPSVSRRHALLVFEGDQALRVLDDRSLNGVFLNGELVDWGKLTDGDELTIGRYQLFALEA